MQSRETLGLSQAVRTPRPNWVNIVVLTLSPMLAAAGLAYYVPRFGVAWTDIATFAVMYLLCGISITAGYHRLYAHRAFECNPVIEFILLLFGAASMQNSAIHWVSDHRNHHRHVDSESDPYNIKKGFFWAHMGWICFEDPRGDDFSNVRDLQKSPMVRWQHKYYLPILIVVGFVLPTLVGWALGRPFAGFLWGGLVRVVLGHHATFLINSAAHYFGHQPHSTAHSAKDSWWLAIVSFGEGYHNFHHTYPSDYRNGVRWYQFDVTKWVIGGLSMVGLARGLRRTGRA